MTVVKYDLERENAALLDQVRELRSQNKLLSDILEDERRTKRKALSDREKSMVSCSEAQAFLEEQEQQRRRLQEAIDEVMALMLTDAMPALPRMSIARMSIARMSSAVSHWHVWRRYRGQLCS